MANLSLEPAILHSAVGAFNVTLASGEVRALATDSTDSSAFWLLEEFPSLKVGLALTEEQQYGFAVAKDSPLRQALSVHIKQLKASGIYFRLLDSHLGAKAVEIVETGKQH
jgi:ABC-type amino acid transport substrate-binding protein